MAIGLRKRRRIQLISICFLMLTALGALIGYAFRDGIQFYRSPSEVLAQVIPADEVFRIGGLVQAGSIEKEGEIIRFRVSDNAAQITVVFEGILPDLFAEDRGMIASGRYDGVVFQAEEILAKHDENYLPREVAETLKEQGVFKETNPFGE